MLGVPFLDDAITKWFKPQQFDDPVDRLNYFVTSSLLAFFAIMVSAKQYVGSPIQCFMPMEFRSGWEQYAEDYCFIQNTYYIPIPEQIPEGHDERQKAEFGYYQWVPVVLALQAVLFYLPNWLWKTLHQQSGLDLDTAISDASKLRTLHSNERRSEIGKLCTYISESLEMNEAQRIPRRILCFRVGQHLGSYVTMLYLFIKICYLLNILLQFTILNNFLETTHMFWGVHTFVQLWQGSDWEETAIFPRVTLCDFRVRRLANIHNYTVQCVLMINMFNEKIYLFIWFWFAFVLISTLMNFFYCCFTLIPPSSRERTIRNFLKQEKLQHLNDMPDTKNIIARFTNTALCPDGVLLLRFIEGHAGAIVARDVTATLFADYIRTLDSSITPYSAPHMMRDMTGTKSTTPGGDDYNEYPTKQISPPYKMIETQPLMEPDSGLPKHKNM
uniref:Innexin n=1 Tax=Panagrolaimus sp. ES5 TaxID=591445 RepID=A0AC34FAQ6_9BILA